VSVQPVFSEDVRTIDELVNFALSEVSEELAWQAVSVLHRRGTAEVLQYAKRLSTSPCDRERRLGADILGQLGVPDRTFPVECATILRGMLDIEQDAAVLTSALIALSFQNCADAIPLVVRFSNHSSANVRHALYLLWPQKSVPLHVPSALSVMN